ncbi:MAG: 4Fe-4S binding protein [Chloroflexi bacterium]|nr:4Fe-4S binding protein [Chloroflexota bacterium]
MNLLAVAEKLAPADRPPVALDAARCVRAQDKLATCEQCVRACPVDALRFDASIALDEKICVACGLCLRVCPVDAFTGDDGVTDLMNWLARLHAQAVELVCPRHPDPTKGQNENAIVLRANTCLAALGASVYLRLLSQVSSVAVRMDACAECAIGRVQPHIADALDAARQFFPERVIAITEKPPSPKIRAVYDAKSPPVSRRDFFRVLTGESVRAATIAFTNESTPTSAAPRERQRVIHALKQLTLADLNVPAAFTGAIRLRADDKCTACGVCARACPTGAMQFSITDNTTYRLTCSVAQCTDCGVCGDVCEPQALQRAGAPTLAEFIASAPMTLHTGALKQCAKCNARFAAHLEGNLCPICDFRRRNPFGSLRPRAQREAQR